MPTNYKDTLNFPKKVNTLNPGPESPLRGWKPKALYGVVVCLETLFFKFPRAQEMSWGKFCSIFQVLRPLQPHVRELRSGPARGRRGLAGSNSPGCACSPQGAPALQLAAKDSLAAARLRCFSLPFATENIRPPPPKAPGRPKARV